MNNLMLLDEWLSSGNLRLQRGRLLSTRPHPSPHPIQADRVAGMLLGLAVGDSLGNTSESTSPGERRQRHGEIRDYLLHSYHGDRRGYPTDDTQLAAWTLEHVLEEGCIVPERLAERFAADRIFGLGSTVRQFLVNWKSGLNWRECGPASAGNGALMRIAPVLLPHLAAGDCELWADVVLASALTHNDYTSTSACLAFTAMLWDLLAMDTPPPSIWWETRYVELAADLEGDVDLHTRGAPSRSGRARSGASCRTSSHGPGDSNLRHVKHATAGTLAPSC